jgi:hypothetical protein
MGYREPFDIGARDVELRGSSGEKMATSARRGSIERLMNLPYRKSQCRMYNRADRGEQSRAGQGTAELEGKEALGVKLRRQKMPGCLRFRSRSLL